MTKKLSQGKDSHKYSLRFASEDFSPQIERGFKMTIAISLKVHNGVVLAADSASTLEAQTSEGEKIGSKHF